MRTSQNLIDRAPTTDLLFPLVNASLSANGNQPPVSQLEAQLYETFHNNCDARSVTPPIEDFAKLKF